MAGTAASMAQATQGRLTAIQVNAERMPPSRGTGNSAALTCPVGGGDAVPSGQEAMRQRLNQLVAFEASCESNPGFQAYRGLLLLQAGWLAEAAIALEKSLLILPDQPGVQLDYAQALAQLGQKSSARQLVEAVASREDIQTGLRDWLRTELEVDTPVWSWISVIQSSVGRETNLASATHTGSLTLFLPNGTVEVPLADSEKPISGLGLKTFIAVQGQRSLGAGSLRTTFSLQARDAQSVATNHLREALLSYAWPAGPGTASFQIASHRYQQTQQYSYADTGWRLKYEPNALGRTCKWSPMLGQVRQQYLSTPNLSGQYGHAGMEVQCAHTATYETSFSFTGGLDTPTQDGRPGGDKRRKEVSVRQAMSVSLPTPGGAGLPGVVNGWYRLSDTQDQELYSPLLGDRNIATRRQDMGFGLWWALAPQWTMGFDWERTLQKSNNVLLNIKNSSFYFGLKWSSKP